MENTPLTCQLVHAAHITKACGPWECRGFHDMALSDFGRSVNPISTRGGRLCPLDNTGSPWFSDLPTTLLKFIYFEKATTFCKISALDLSCVVTVKFTAEISQNFGAFSKYMNFTYRTCSWHVKLKLEKLRPFEKTGVQQVNLTPPNVRTKLVATLNAYSCNKITTTWIQNSRQNWNDFFSKFNHQNMI